MQKDCYGNKDHLDIKKDSKNKFLYIQFSFVSFFAKTGILLPVRDFVTFLVCFIRVIYCNQEYFSQQDCSGVGEICCLLGQTFFEKKNYSE